MSRGPMVGLGIALAFIVWRHWSPGLFLGAQPSNFVGDRPLRPFGAYMAVNIGANDVATTWAPPSVPKALSMGGAIINAAICEKRGCIAGGRGTVVFRHLEGDHRSPRRFADIPSVISLWAMSGHNRRDFISALWDQSGDMGATLCRTHTPGRGGV